MLFVDTLERAREIGASAAACLVRYGLAPTPVAYAVWYAHLGMHNPDMSNALGILLSNRQPISDETCIELYLRYLAPDHEQRALEEAGMGLRGALDTAASLLGEAGQDVTVFRGSLVDAQARLEADAGADHLQEVVNSLVEQTQWMSGRARDLQESLEDSAEAVHAVRRDLEVIRLAAVTDALTGVANRRRFDEVLRGETAKAMDMGTPLSLALADIDHFKDFNDRHGHQTGDLVLRSVAQMLVSGVRDGDLVARFGGEEFVIIMPGTELTAALEVAERLRTRLAAKRIVKRGSNQDIGSVNMSSGVAEYRPGEPISSLIARADAALYQAKKAGRNRVEPETRLPKNKI